MRTKQKTWNRQSLSPLSVSCLGELGGGACIPEGSPKACSSVSEIPASPLWGPTSARPAPAPSRHPVHPADPAQGHMSTGQRGGAAAWQLGRQFWGPIGLVRTRGREWGLGKNQPVGRCLGRVTRTWSWGLTVPTMYSALLGRGLESPAWDWSSEDCCFYFSLLILIFCL